jgi:hypothetical protein
MTVADNPVAVRTQLLSRIRGEYLEMPGLRLTHAQAQRLWGLDAQTCSSVLKSLTEDKFLCQRSDGTYCRLPDTAVVPSGLRNSSHFRAKNPHSGARIRT